LVATVHRLRREPIGALTPMTSAPLVGQHVGLEVLVPRVLTLLEEDPLLAGDLHEGTCSPRCCAPRPSWSASSQPSTSPARSSGRTSRTSAARSGEPVGARQTRNCWDQLLSTFNPTGQDTPVPPNPQ